MGGLVGCMPLTHQRVTGAVTAMRVHGCIDAAHLRTAEAGAASKAAAAAAAPGTASGQLPLPVELPAQAPLSGCSPVLLLLGAPRAALQRCLGPRAT